MRINKRDLANLEKAHEALSLLAETLKQKETHAAECVAACKVQRRVTTASAIRLMEARQALTDATWTADKAFTARNAVRDLINAHKIANGEPLV